ncbi:hypothetical protein FRC02_001884 [Tulasnella sp. 418]|nr:hypothetical protein FRC02_001884 [Tulasnella sp. 418]
MTSNVSSTKDRPIVAVCSARGRQGGNVIKALLARDEFSIRALTRCPPGSSGVEKLASMGVEIVQADYDKPETLEKAFKGCYGVFGVTDWYEAQEGEIRQGKNIVDAAKLNGVKHFVWSSGADMKGAVCANSTKHAVAEYLMASGMPYTCVTAPVFYDSFLLVLEKATSGGYKMSASFPIDARVPYASPVDWGIWVATILSDPQEWINKSVKPCSEWLLTTEMGETLTEVTGEQCVIPPITTAQFLAFEPTEESLHNEKTMMEFYLGTYSRQEFSYNLGHQLSPHPKLWRDVCEEMVEANETTTKSPVDGPYSPLDVQVFQYSG